MQDLDIYYKLVDDPDPQADLIINDLCLENNWAYDEQYVYPVWLRYRQFQFKNALGSIGNPDTSGKTFFSRWDGAATSYITTPDYTWFRPRIYRSINYVDD
jgi:hypothetical protein